MRVADRIDTVDLETSVDGAAWGLDHMTTYSAVATITGTVEGTIKLQACNNAFTDNVGLQEDPNAVWVDIPSTSNNVTNDGVFMYNTGDFAAYRAVRMVWTNSSGSGTMKIYWHAKGPQS